jgi:Kef-type K+ transport system membrane component KefB
MGYQPRMTAARPRIPRLAFLGALAALLVGRIAQASTGAGGDDLLAVLEALVLILIAGKLGGAAFEAMGQSSVLGELLAGVVIGNLGLVGIHAFDGLRTLPGLELLAQIGVLFLLFQVGLETDIRKMMAVGSSSLLVAVLGVIAPMALGWLVSRAFFPDAAALVHVFVGATLCATSVGITARVLRELGKVDSPEGRIILGAAVIDDVLGLIVLAVVVGIIQAADRGASFQPASIALIVAKALGFLIVAVVVGDALSRRVFRLAAGLKGEGLLLSLAIAFCFLTAWLAGRAGLAPIVGAFSAGMVLDEVYYQDLRARDHQKRSVPELLEPIAGFLVPVFFVLMGMHVDLTVFGNAEVIGFAVVLTIAAIVGKQLCALGVLHKGADRLAIGLGMIPRGEVGLILASVGASLTLGGVRVIDNRTFSALVAMVALTTLLTPPLLVLRMRQRTPHARRTRSS